MARGLADADQVPIRRARGGTGGAMAAETIRAAALPSFRSLPRKQAPRSV
ncbi:MAG: hypothetical protein ACK4TB_11685 [Gemmobacter sp.]